MEQQTYFLRLYDIAFPVNWEQYQDYYKEQNRWNYLQKLDCKYRLTYYHALDTNEYFRRRCGGTKTFVGAVDAMYEPTVTGRKNAAARAVFEGKDRAGTEWRYRCATKNN